MVHCTAITLSGKRCKKLCKEKLCWVHTPPDTCGICLDPVNNFIKLDCGHKFCGDCVNEWLCSLKSQTCPTCRSEVSKKIRNDAYGWGFDTFRWVVGTQYILDLSNLEINSQLNFILKTNVVKNTELNFDEIFKIRTLADLDPELKIVWNNIWNNVKAEKLVLVNESHKKPYKPVTIYTFV